MQVNYLVSLAEFKFTIYSNAGHRDLSSHFPDEHMQNQGQNKLPGYGLADCIGIMFLLPQLLNFLTNEVKLKLKPHLKCLTALFFTILQQKVL